MPLFARPLSLAIAGLAAMITTGFAHAQSRPEASQLTCQAASALVNSRGAVVLTTGPGTYERVVRDGGACLQGDDYLLPAYLATKDSRSCGVGFYCSPRINRSK